jgi:DNA-binding NtrC family response regulator
MRMLETAGFVATGCVRPREALARFRADPAAFALVVTDLSMPEMSGLDLAAELQRIRPGTPVVLTTGYLRAGDEAVAQSAGIREIIHKPQNLDQLVPTIVRLLDLTPPAA